MKVIWAVLCQSSAVDRDTNVVSLFNVVEEITFPAPPPEPTPSQQLPAGLNLAPIFQLVVLWTRSDQKIPEQGRGRLRLLRPNNAEALGQEFEVNLTQHLRLRLRIPLAGLPTDGEGIHQFVVEGMTGTSAWTSMFELPLSVVFQRQDSG